ncbi:uncharacterized protein LOC115078852 [Rhinatrema bivittatum]|uniref:uncharacterized protein LOC115078852 n=1 Tax=Rhinatrema bivittatum TaxID=194408 RepID=UPI00112AB655|nr:uncharacterized protein LOC115078852 [Rhinatrema bivittatum]
MRLTSGTDPGICSPPPQKPAGLELERGRRTAMEAEDPCPSRSSDRASLMEEKQEITLQPASSASTAEAQAHITLLRDGLALRDAGGRAGKPCLPGQSALLTPASNSLILTGESAKVIMKVKALGSSPAEGRDHRPQTFLLTPAAARWAGQGGEVARLLPAALDLGQILHGPQPVLLTQANGGGGQASAMGEEVLLRGKERPPPAGAQAPWRTAGASTRPQPPPGGVHSGSLGDMSLSCSSKGVYENFRRWQQYKSLARRHFPKSPDAEAVSCFLIPVLRSLARLKPEMRIEEGVPRAVQEWERISNFDRMVFYEMAEKFMEFEEEEELQMQKVQLSSQYQHPPAALRLPDPKRESLAAAEVARQQVYFPKKATAKAPQPKRRQRRPAARAIAQVAAKEVPPEAVAQYVEIMEGLKIKTEDPNSEEEPVPDQELLSYIHRLCDIDTFVSKVEAVIHPGFLAGLLSPEKERDPLSLTDELEEEENLTVDELVQKRLSSLSEGETPQDCCCGGPQFTSTPYQSDEEDDDSKLYTSRSPGFLGSQRSSTSLGMKMSSLSSEESSRAKLSPMIPQTQEGNLNPKRQPQPCVGKVAMDASFLQQKSDSGSLDSPASDGQGQSDGRRLSGSLLFPKICTMVPTVKVASMEKGQQSGSMGKTEEWETRIVQRWQEKPTGAMLFSPHMSNDQKSQKADLRVAEKGFEGNINIFESAIPEGMRRSRDILLGNINAKDLSCPGDQGVTYYQSRSFEPKLHSVFPTTISQLREHNQDPSSQQLANNQRERGLGPPILAPDLDGGLQFQAIHLLPQANHLPNQISYSHLQLKDTHVRLQGSHLQKQANHSQPQANHFQLQASPLQNQTKHPEPETQPAQNQLSLSVLGTADATQDLRDGNQLPSPRYSLAVLVDSKSSLVASLTKCDTENGVQPLGNEIRMTFNHATVTSSMKHNAPGENKQQQQQLLEVSGPVSLVSCSTGRSLSKFLIHKGQQQMESQCDSKLDLAHSMTETLTSCSDSKGSQCHRNSDDSHLAVALPLISSTTILTEQNGNQAWSTNHCNAKPHSTCASCTPIESSSQHGCLNPIEERNDVVDLQTLETPSQCITMKGRWHEEVSTSTVLGNTTTKCGRESESHHQQLKFTQPVLDLESSSSLLTMNTIREDGMLQDGTTSCEEWGCSLNSPTKSAIEQDGGDSIQQYECQNGKAYMALTCPVGLQAVTPCKQDESPNLETVTLDSEWACMGPEAVCPAKPDGCQQRFNQEEIQGSEVRLDWECARVTSVTQTGSQEELPLHRAPNAILMDVLSVSSTAHTSQEQNLHKSNHLNSHSVYTHQSTESPTACNSDEWCKDHQALQVDLQCTSALSSQDCSKEERNQNISSGSPQLNMESLCPLTVISEINSSQKEPKDHKAEGPGPKPNSEKPAEEPSTSPNCQPPMLNTTVHFRASSNTTIDEGTQQESWQRVNVIPLGTKIPDKNNSPQCIYGTSNLENEKVAVGEGTRQAKMQAIDPNRDSTHLMTLPPVQGSSRQAGKLNEICPTRATWNSLQDAWGSLQSIVSLKPDHGGDGGQENSNGECSGLLHYNSAQEGLEQPCSIPDLNFPLAQVLEKGNSQEKSLEHLVSEVKMEPNCEPHEQLQTQASTMNQSQTSAEEKATFMRKESLNCTGDFRATDGCVNQDQWTFQGGNFKSQVSVDGHPPEAQENLQENCSGHQLPGTDSAPSTPKEQCCHLEIRKDIEAPSASHTYLQPNSLLLGGEAEARPSSVASAIQGNDPLSTTSQLDCDSLEQIQRGIGKRKSPQTNMEHGEGGSVAKMMLKSDQEGSVTIASLVSEEKLQEDPTDHSWDIRLLTLTRHPKRDQSNRVLRRSKRLNSGLTVSQQSE